MKKITKMITVHILAMMLLLSSSIISMAKTADVAILANKAWTSDSDNTDSRSGKYNTVYARCLSVWPESGTDNFTKIKCRATNGYGKVITEEVTLDENNTSSTSISIKEGYRNVTFVGFQFRGNSNASANSRVSYSGR